MIIFILLVDGVVIRAYEREEQARQDAIYLARSKEDYRDNKATWERISLDTYRMVPWSLDQNPFTGKYNIIETQVKQ